MAFKTELPNHDLFESADRNTRREVKILAEEISEAVATLRQAENEANIAKERLKVLSKEAYWEDNFRAEVPVHTYDVRDGAEDIQINFINKYFLNAERRQQLLELVGEDSPIADNFKKLTIVNVDVSSLDQKRQVEFFKACSELTKEYDLQGFVDDKFEVDKGFHDSRHNLIAGVNRAIDSILPIEIQITT